jgi:tryptophanyl-tRNA synthetase
LSKGRILSGIRPTGRLHLGNYLGALENWVRLQNEYECFFSIVDWHALTTGYEDTADLQENIREMLLDWLSVGIDPEKSTLFVQSHVKAHAELHLILSMITPLGWLERNPTYKEQLQQLSEREITTYGFLGYPVLQAADILAYRADTVPVGEDQLPHLELAREIARRFNFLYEPIFPEPQAKMNQVRLLPGLDGRKMSKSYGNTIALSQEPAETERLIRNMVTDPSRARRSDPGDPGVCPAYSYHKIFNQARSVEIDPLCRAAGIGCVDCKKELAQSYLEFITPIRERRERFAKETGLLEEILTKGAEKARAEAEKTMEMVRKAVRL